MTPILFLVGYFVGLGLTLFRGPIYGLYTYMFAFYLAPDYTWWRNDVPDLRYLFLAAIFAIAVSFWEKQPTGRREWPATAPGKLFGFFVVYNWVMIAWAIDPELQREGAILYTKHYVIAYLIYRLATNLERIRDIALAHVIGCGWFGYQALGAGGGRLEEIGGAVAGANELGVHVSSGLLFGGMLLLTVRGARFAGVFAALPLIANTLILTISRGAFLGLFAGGAVAYTAVSKAFRKTFVVYGILALALFSLLAHDQLITRFAETYLALTNDQEELDQSASSRTEIAKAGFRMAADYPLGAGHRATAILSPVYMEEYLLGNKGVRSAHNTVAAIAAEQGLPGLFYYFSIILWALAAAWQLRRSRGKVGSDPLALYSVFTVASFIGILASGNFSNNVDLETQYWCMALLAAMIELRRLQPTVESEVKDPDRTASGSRV